MIRSIALIIVCGMTFHSFGCISYRAPVKPPYGQAFTQYNVPLDLEYGTEIGSRVGKSKSVSILGLISWGDASVNAAVRNGKLKRVDYVGYEMLNVLLFYQGWKTVAYGE